MDASRCGTGEWVEVERVLLEPADRSAALPPETAEKPMLVWVSGFAKGEAGLGEDVTVETMAGRLVTGRLSEINPGYFHTFGRPPAELVAIGRDLRERLAAYRAGEAAAADEGAVRDEPLR